jgi:hypothetical protein
MDSIRNFRNFGICRVTHDSNLGANRQSRLKFTTQYIKDMSITKFQSVDFYA